MYKLSPENPAKWLIKDLHHSPVNSGEKQMEKINKNINKKEFWEYEYVYMLHQELRYSKTLHVIISVHRE